MCYSGHSTLPPCCSPSANEPCDGKVLPTEDKDRGKDYNHSTFIDLIISGTTSMFLKSASVRENII